MGVEVGTTTGVSVGVEKGVSVDAATLVAVGAGRAVAVGAAMFVAVGDGIGAEVTVSETEVGEAGTIVGCCEAGSVPVGVSNMEVGAGD